MIDDLSVETVLELLENNETNVMPFGKHKGKPLSKVPPSYLAWLKSEGAFNKPQNAQLKSAFEKIGAL